MENFEKAQAVSRTETQTTDSQIERLTIHTIDRREKCHIPWHWMAATLVLLMGFLARRFFR